MQTYENRHICVTLHKAKVQVDQGPPHKTNYTESYRRKTLKHMGIGENFLNRTPSAYALRSTVPPLKGCAGLFVLHVSVGYSKSSVDNVQLIAPGIFAVHTSLPKESLKGTNNYHHYRCRKREKIQYYGALNVYKTWKEANTFL